MIPFSEPTLTFTIEARLARHVLDDRVAADPVLRDRAGRGRASRTRRGHPHRRGRGRRRRADAALRGVEITMRAEVAEIRDRASPRCSRCGPATSSRSTPGLERRDRVRRPGARAPRAARSQRQPARDPDHRSRGGGRDERGRRAHPARRVHVRGRRERHADVRPRRGAARPDRDRERRQRPAGHAPTPAVTASVSYVDGVTGGNVFVMPVKAARALAAAMMGEAQPEDDATELTELELSAAGEAMNQMMACRGERDGLRARHRGRDRATGHARARLAGDRARGPPGPAHLTSAVFSVFGQPCRLIQLVPNAFVMRMTQALDELGAEYLGDQARPRRPSPRPGRPRCAACPCACGPS